MCQSYVAAEIQRGYIDFSREVLVYITGGSGSRTCMVSILVENKIYVLYSFQ